MEKSTICCRWCFGCGGFEDALAKLASPTHLAEAVAPAAAAAIAGAGAVAVPVPVALVVVVAPAAGGGAVAVTVRARCLPFWKTLRRNPELQNP